MIVQKSYKFQNVLDYDHCESNAQESFLFIRLRARYPKDSPPLTRLI